MNDGGGCGTHDGLSDGGADARVERQALERQLQQLLDRPLRQALVAPGCTPSQVLIRSVERMMPRLRFFRHGDGTLARFNGMGATIHDRVAAILPLYQQRIKDMETIIRAQRIVTLPERPMRVRLASEAESAAVPRSRQAAVRARKKDDRGAGLENR